MTQFQELLDGLQIEGPLPVDATTQPLGTAWLPQLGAGIDIAAYGYVEEEFLVAGAAATWTWDPQHQARELEPQSFTTRLLVRRPVDPARFSGAVQLEPHHPDDDRALSWGMIAPWILRHGHVHVGVTQEPAVVADLVGFDPVRYGRLALDEPTQRWEILGQAAAALKLGLVAGVNDVSRIIGSGWSMTGTFWRTFLGERFHERCSLDGRPVNDGYVVCISSGGAGRAGYASLGQDEQLPASDARRTVGGHGVPVVELLSEGESETQLTVMREDADGPEDFYRLYQVAGTGHIITGVRAFATNRVQLRERGAPSLPREIVEPASDARMDHVARAVFDSVDRWISKGTAPPRAARFAYEDPDSPALRGLMPESVPLARDGDGNAIGGVRTPWVEVPSATYLPHSTPRPGRCQPAPHAPYSDPKLLADLIAHSSPFDVEELTRRYGDSERFLRRFEQAAHEASASGWILEEDLPELLQSKAEHVGHW